MHKIIYTLLLLCLTYSMRGQQVTLEARISYLYNNYPASTLPRKSLGGRFIIKLNGNNLVNNADCIATNSNEYSSSDLIYLNTPGTYDVNADLVFHFETWHERSYRFMGFDYKSDQCEFNSSGSITKQDELGYYIDPPYTVSLKSSPPGIWYKAIDLTMQVNGVNLAIATIDFRYSIPKPETPKYSHTFTQNLTNFCSDKYIQLETDVKPNNSGLKYNWSYLVPGYTIDTRAYDYTIYGDWQFSPQRCSEYINGYYEHRECLNRPWSQVQSANVAELLLLHPWTTCGHREDRGSTQTTPVTVFVPGACTETIKNVIPDSWVPIQNDNPANDRYFTISSPLDKLFGGSLSSAATRTFRVQATSDRTVYSNGIPIPIFGLSSEYSNYVTYTFLPPAPKLTASNLIIEPSCKSSNTGFIRIYNNAISSSAGYAQWIIKEGHNQTAGCTINVNDGNIGSNCGFNTTSSEGLVKIPKLSTDAPILIDGNGKNEGIGLKPGDYTLWLINEGGTTGLCYNTVNITIPTVDDPSMVINSTNISCNGGNNGSISVKGIGGKKTAGGYTIIISKDATELRRFAVDSNTVVTADNLLAGTYTIELINACKIAGGLNPTQTVTITEPVKVNATIVVAQPTCANPNNAVITVNTIAGNGNYSYTLYKEDGSLVEPATVTTSTTKQFNNLAAGTYKVAVLDADRLSCTGFEQQNITILAAPPIVRSSLTKTEVTCFGGNDGSLQIRGTGGAGGTSNLTYTLTNTTTNQIRTSDEGSFTGLSAGTYTASIKNKPITGCNDAYNENVTVTEKPEMVVAFQNINIRCKNDANGTLKATVTGGSGTSFSYQWQKLVNNTFTNYRSNEATLTNVEPGTYRVIVTDNGSGPNCKKTSAETIITEPNVLSITNVAATQAACAATAAYINITTTGGNGTNTYWYKLGNGNWVSFIPGTATSTPVGTGFTTAGDYSIKVTDNKNCEALYNNTVTLNFATSVLTSTEVLNNYNGTNIACFGGADTIKVTASGGVPPYEYQVDNGSYSIKNAIPNIGAGAHTVYIRDARNCIITKNITLTQPAMGVRIFNVTTTPVVCQNDATGTISIAAGGGVGSITYSINNGLTYQASNTFNQLTYGSYRIRVKDANGCVASTTSVLQATNPIIFVPFKPITNITCFGESTGSVTVNATTRNATGTILGNASLTYKWEGINNTTNALSNVPAGKYILKITDGSTGCYLTDTTIITEPQQLLFSTENTAPCDATADGLISIQASGGILPYQYSNNNGVSFVGTSTFAGLTAGKYNIVVKDANNCVTRKEITLSNRNVKPTVIDFLIASRQNERDTLIIREACSFIPDAISWRFHADAIVLTPSNARDPKIRFNTVGNYWAEMTGKFGDCFYTVRRNISIAPYDPNAGPSTVTFDRIIDTIRVAPNPNDGKFNLTIKLNKRQRVQLHIVNTVGGSLAYTKTYDRTELVSEDINLPALVASGTYVVRVITENDSRDIMIIVNK